MTDLGPCCPQSSPGLVHITIKGVPVGFTGLREIVGSVKALDLDDEDVIKEALLERVKETNYVPPTLYVEYKQALFDFYVNVD